MLASRFLLWGDATTSIMWGAGRSFHAFNESRPPCPVRVYGAKVGFQICIVSDQIPPTYYVETPSFLYIKTIKNYLVALSDSFQWYVITALAEVVVVQAHAAFTSERETSKILSYSKNIYKRILFVC